MLQLNACHLIHGLNQTMSAQLANKHLFDVLYKRLRQEPFYMLSYFTADDKTAIARNKELLLAEEYLKKAQELINGTK